MHFKIQIAIKNLTLFYGVRFFIAIFRSRPSIDHL